MASHEDLARSSFEAFMRGDWDALAGAMDPDVQWLWYEPGEGLQGPQERACERG